MAEERRKTPKATNTSKTTKVSKPAKESDELNELINSSRMAASVFISSVEKENQIFLNFCDTLLRQAANTVKEIERLGGTTMRIAEDISNQKKLSSKNLAAKSMEVTKALSQAASNNKLKKSTIGASSTDPSVDFANNFVDSMNIMMNNYLNAQSQAYILAQTATTMGIIQIYSVDTIADAIAIAQMSMGGKK